ncbi:MAG: hypothetical protein ILO34_09195, partial [Kiritimatiellae bacterium]|nr:hypothetical protein [Kiritimatiellia bacterium]
MEVWERNEADRPSVFSGFNFAAAAVVHVIFFGGVWALNGFSVFKPEKAIPIKLTIVVNENLDGVENEPPPLNDPVPPPPPPRPKPPEPKKEPEKPKELEKIAT